MKHSIVKISDKHRDSAKKPPGLVLIYRLAIIVGAPPPVRDPQSPPYVPPEPWEYHAQPFKDASEIPKFLEAQEIDEEEFVGVWKLGHKVEFVPSEVPVASSARVWTKA